MNTGKLTVFGHPMSTCTRKVLTTLVEKGQAYDFTMVDIMKGEAKKPEYLARHPFGVVPLLQDGDFELYESRAIMRYLDARASGPALTPANLQDRGRMEQFISIEHSYFSGPAMRIVFQNLFIPMGGGTPSQEIIDKARAELARPLGVLDKALGQRAYLAGDDFSLAEITYMPYIEYLFAAKAGDLITDHAHVAAWWSRISERASWQKVARGK